MVTTLIIFTTMELDAFDEHFYDSRIKLLKVMSEFFNQVHFTDGLLEISKTKPSNKNWITDSIWVLH